MQVNKEVPKMFNKENLCFLKKKQKYQSENTFEEKQAWTQLKWFLKTYFFKKTSWRIFDF